MMNKSKSFKIGIIAEDDSDVDAARVLIRRISNNKDVEIRKFVGRGCGRIKRKCMAWANILKTKGCRYLILIHDLDRNNLTELKMQIDSIMNPCPIANFLVCIPIEEMEAWFLADPNAIQAVFNLPKPPIIKGHPQSISSPKEKIGDLVKKYSNKKQIYLNTKHNYKIAEHLDFNKAKRCDSFVPFHNFIASNIAN